MPGRHRIFNSIPQNLSTMDNQVAGFHNQGGTKLQQKIPQLIRSIIPLILKVYLLFFPFKDTYKILTISCS